MLAQSKCMHGTDSTREMWGLYPDCKVPTLACIQYPLIILRDKREWVVWKLNKTRSDHSNIKWSVDVSLWCLKNKGWQTSKNTPREDDRSCSTLCEALIEVLSRETLPEAWFVCGVTLPDDVYVKYTHEEGSIQCSHVSRKSTERLHILITDV